MNSNKIKTLIGFGLCTLLIGAGALTMGSTDFISKLTRAEGNYICAGNVRLEPNGDGSYTITHIGAGATTVDISDYILDNYDVVTISADAFDDCRDTLTSITIDANVPIEDGAFNNMTNELDVTFTGDMTEINYGHIFENTTIGTMTIPETVTYVNPEMFYCIDDTTNLIYEGDFNTFYNSIFHSLWIAFQETLQSDTHLSEQGNHVASMPTNIVVDGKTYHIPDNTTYSTYFSTELVRYYNSKNKEAFGYKNNNYYKNDKNI